MIIKKIFFQEFEGSDWEEGITFECVGTMDNEIINQHGDIIINIPFSTREPINEQIIIEI